MRGGLVEKFRDVNHDHELTTTIRLGQGMLGCPELEEQGTLLDNSTALVFFYSDEISFISSKDDFFFFMASFSRLL